MTVEEWRPVPAHEGASTCIAVVRCQRPPLHGHICGVHLQRMSDMLREIENEAQQLSAVPSMQIRSGRGGSLASQRAPARLDVLVHNDPRSWQAGERKPGPACHECWHDTCMDIRRWMDAYDSGALDVLSVLGTLHSWARLVREERALASPADPATVASERGLLSRHLEFAAAQPWIDELYGDLSKLLGQLRSANHHRPDRPIARCVLPDVDGLCGGDVWEQERTELVTYADGSRYHASTPDGPAACSRCGATWATPEDKARLRLMIEQEHDERTRPRTEDGRKMLTAEELVAEGKVSTVSNVRVQAHRRGVSAVNGHYDPDWFGERMAG